MKPLDEYELAIALLGPLLPIDSEPMSEIFQRIKSHDNSLIGTRARILLSAASNEPFDGYALEYLLDWAEQLELERGDILARIETMIQSRSE
jgi:hypothetical protein